MKIGKLNMHCGECKLIEYCGEPYSDIAICGEERFKDVDEEEFMKLAKTSPKWGKKAILNDVAKRLKMEGKH